MSSSTASSRLRVDATACTGHGMCYSAFPDLFEEDDRGHCVVRDVALVDADVLRDAHDATENCPEAALSIVGTEV